MKRIIFVSSNQNKAKEVSTLLTGKGIKCTTKKLEMRETGRDQKKIAEMKARDAFRVLEKQVIVEDTGIYFSALKNFPGVLAKREFIKIGFNGLLKKIKGKTRSAKFVTIVAYFDGVTMRTFTGTCFGRLTEEIDWIGYKKRPKFPYEAIFVPNGGIRRFSQMSRKEKAIYSHRAKAVYKFAHWFKRM